MRTQYFLSIVSVLYMALALTVGCATSKTNPLADWHNLGLNNNSVDETVRKDYEAFIQSQLNQKNITIGEIWFFEDGSGRHAVSVQFFSKKNPTVWTYAIIYDKEDKREKVIKYGYGWYQS